MPQLTQELRDFLFFPPPSHLNFYYDLSLSHAFRTIPITLPQELSQNTTIQNQIETSQYGFMLGATSGCSTLRDVGEMDQPCWGLPDRDGWTYLSPHMTAQPIP